MNGHSARSFSSTGLFLDDNKVTKSVVYQRDGGGKPTRARADDKNSRSFWQGHDGLKDQEASMMEAAA
jgi:hypothetical protein